MKHELKNYNKILKSVVNPRKSLLHTEEHDDYR